MLVPPAHNLRSANLYFMTLICAPSSAPKSRQGKMPVSSGGPRWETFLRNGTATQTQTHDCVLEKVFHLFQHLYLPSLFGFYLGKTVAKTFLGTLTILGINIPHEKHEHMPHNSNVNCILITSAYRQIKTHKQISHALNCQTRTSNAAQMFQIIFCF